MDSLLRLLLRFVLVPLGFLAAAIAGTLVIVGATWGLVEAATGGHPDGPVYALYGFAVGGPIMLVLVIVFMFLPASLGILISEAFAIRSWMFHAFNGVVSAWLGWQLYDAAASTGLPVDRPTIVIAAGLAGGFAYWAVAGFSAGFWKPVFRRDPAPAVPQHPGNAAPV